MVRVSECGKGNGKEHGMAPSGGTYLAHQLTHHSVPAAMGTGFLRAVIAILDQAQLVCNTHGEIGITKNIDLFRQELIIIYKVEATNFCEFRECSLFCYI